MSKKLCFQEVSSLQEIPLAERLRIITGWKTSPAKKNEIVLDPVFCNDASSRYKVSELKPKNANDNLKIIVREGTVVTESKNLPLKEITIVYSSQNTDVVKALIDKLCRRMSLILVDADLEQRLAQEIGIYDFTKLQAYKKGRIQVGVVLHLSWQLYVVSKAWQQFLQEPYEKVFIRQLRVKLRRLRSTLSFFKPLFNKNEVSFWQETLKKRGELLSTLRELDVALMNCDKMRFQAEESEGKLIAPVQIEQFLLGLRAEELEKCLDRIELGEVTAELAKFNLWLKELEPLAGLENVKIKRFIETRLLEWSEKLEKIDRKYPDFHNMLELHQIRIKVKRFRYALQTLPEAKRNSNLLRQLKRLQDMLGFLHDDFINAKMAQSFFAEQKNLQLRYEVGLFVGWERAKAEAAIENLPQLWGDFCRTLRHWRKEKIIIR